MLRAFDMAHGRFDGCWFSVSSGLVDLSLIWLDLSVHGKWGDSWVEAAGSGPGWMEMRLMM